MSIWYILLQDSKNSIADKLYSLKRSNKVVFEKQFKIQVEYGLDSR